MVPALTFSSKKSISELSGKTDCLRRTNVCASTALSAGIRVN